MSATEVETPADFGADKAATAARWISELEFAERYWKKYRDTRCETILKRYEDEREKEVESKRRFAIFWSNIETLKPACYARVPQAVVLRRFNDPDPVGRIAAEVLERAINFSIDAYDFDQVLKDIRDEFLLLAKGHGWVRYIPTFGEAEQTPAVDAGGGEDPKAKPTASAAPPEPAQKVTYEQVVCDYVSYQDWGTNKCRKWSEVRFVYRRVYLNRDALVQRFGAKIGKAVPLDYKPEGVNDTDANADQFKQAIVYEIWDKVSRKAYWISKVWPRSPLDERADPLGLEDFFPCAKPAFGTTSPRTIIPIPDYVQYQDQCEELDDLTVRIGVLTKAVRMVGLYAADEKINLQQVFKASAENDMIPVESWMAWMDKGGIKGLIEWVPVDKVIQVLDSLQAAREICIKIIYQICAIPDIMRGDTDPDETAAAQGLKSTWGSSRMREKQKEMARFCRDSMRIKGQVIAKKFDIKTIAVMTNVQLLTNAEKQEITVQLELHKAREAMMAQQAQAMGQAQPPMPGQPPAPPQAPPQPTPPPVRPDKLALMDKPSWEDIDGLLKSDGLRQFRIDIETDATVEPDIVSDRRDASEYLTALGGIINSTFEPVKSMPPLGKVVGAAVKAITRKYQLGREMEETVEKAFDEIGQMPPAPPAQTGMSPEEIALEEKRVMVEAEATKVAMAKVEQEGRNSELDAQTNMATAQAEMERTRTDERIANQDALMRRLEAFLDAQTRTQEAAVDAETSRHEIDTDAEIRRHEADKAHETAKATAAAKTKTNGTTP